MKYSSVKEKVSMNGKEHDIEYIIYNSWKYSQMFVE
jgi:hypothetical protein